MTVGELKRLIADLDDGVLVRGFNDEVPIIVLADFADLPDDNRPPPVLIIEL